MNPAGRVGVVIPSFNHARYLAHTVGSVLAQTRKPDRFIVVDDGSDDGSPEVLKSFETQGVEVVSQANAGAHNALNRGVRMVADDCDVVAVLNSDDLYEPERLARCLAHLETHPEAEVVTTAFTVIDDEGAPLPDDAPRAKWFRAAWSAGAAPDVGLAEWLGTANFLGTTSNIVARAPFLAANPFRPYRYCHDYFLFARAAIEGKLALLRDEKLLRYRVHGHNTMNTAPGPVVQELVRMHLELYRELGYDVISQPQMRERFQHYVRASWNNVSAFHPGLFQALLARLASTARDDEIQEVLVVLGESHAPEFAHYPNKALVNAFDGSDPVTVTTALADRYEKLKAEHAQLKAEAAALRDLARLRQKLLASKRVSLGHLLGKCRDASSDNGKSPDEKLAKLKAKLHDNPWMKGLGD